MRGRKALGCNNYSAFDLVHPHGQAVCVSIAGRVGGGGEFIACILLLGALIFLSIFFNFKFPTDVVIGFEKTIFNVTEEVGYVELCLVVVSSSDISFEYRIGTETVEGTAGTCI